MVRLERTATGIRAPAKLIGYIESNQCLQLSIAAEAEKAVYDETRTLKNAKTTTLIEDRLLPVRQAYYRANRPQRTAILAQVIRYITEGTTT